MTTRRSFLRAATLTAVASTLTGPRWTGAAPGPSSLHRFAAALQPRGVVRDGALIVVWLDGGEGGPAPEIATLDDAQAHGDLLITERGSGTVPELIVENRGKVHVLLLAGEILLGGKQNRVLREDLLLPPLSGPRPISVYCLEQGRWSGSRREFESKASVAQPSLRRELLRQADQNRVWATVHHALRAQGVAPSPTQSYQGLYEAPDVRRRLDEAERLVDQRAAAGAVGAMVVIADEIAGLDAFQDAGLFMREWRKLVRAHAVEGYRRMATRVVPDDELRTRARALLDAAGAAAGTSRGNAGVGQLFACRTSDFHGAALEHEGRVVHLASCDPRRRADGG